MQNKRLCILLFVGFLFVGCQSSKVEYKRFGYDSIMTANKDWDLHVYLQGTEKATYSGISVLSNPYTLHLKIGEPSYSVSSHRPNKVSIRSVSLNSTKTLQSLFSSYYDDLTIETNDKGEWQCSISWEGLQLPFEQLKFKVIIYVDKNYIMITDTFNPAYMEGNKEDEIIELSCFP